MCTVKWRKYIAWTLPSNVCQHRLIPKRYGSQLMIFNLKPCPLLDQQYCIQDVVCFRAHKLNFVLHGLYLSLLVKLFLFFFCKIYIHVIHVYYFQTFETPTWQLQKRYVKVVLYYVPYTTYLIIISILN